MSVALPTNNQVLNVPAPPAMKRFWNPGGSRTVTTVSTLPRLSLVTEPELFFDHLQLEPQQHGAIRAELRVGKALEFRGGSGDFALDHDDEE